MSGLPHWSGWEHCWHCQQAVRRRNSTTDVRVALRSDRLFNLIDGSTQIKFEHVSDVTLQRCNAWAKSCSSRTGLSCAREGNDMRQPARESIFEFKRLSDESLSMFVLRREKQFSETDNLGMPLLEQIKGCASRGGSRPHTRTRTCVFWLEGASTPERFRSLFEVWTPRAQRTFYEADNETLLENDEDSREERLLDS